MDYAVTLKGFVEMPIADNNTAVAEFNFTAIEENAGGPLDALAFATGHLRSLYENASEIVIEEVHAVKHTG